MGKSVFTNYLKNAEKLEKELSNLKRFEAGEYFNRRKEERSQKKIEELAQKEVFYLENFTPEDIIKYEEYFQVPYEL